MIEIKITGLKKALRRLSDFKESIQEPDSYKESTRTMGAAILRNYNTITDDKIWPERTQDYSWPLLNKTGIKQQIELSTTIAPYQKTSEGVEKSISTTFYGVYHHEGRKRLPRRRSVYFSPEDRKQIKKDIKEGILNG